MCKVIFFFAGTGDVGGKTPERSTYMAIKEGKHRFLDGVIRIYIKGCRSASVGGGILLPNLDIGPIISLGLLKVKY